MIVHSFSFVNHILQVHQLVQVAQKCQSTIAECGADGISSQELQANGNM